MQMKFTRWSFLVSIFLLLLISCTSKKIEKLDLATEESLKDRISAINLQIDQWYQEEEVDSYIDIYHEDLTLCPEYKVAIFDKNRLKKFYEDWWQLCTTKHYQKTIYEVQSFGEYVLEDGHFSIDYLDAEGESKQYGGMYFVIWKKEKDNELKILSEGFCSDTYRQSHEMPYASVQVEEQLDFPASDISDSLFKLIHEANDNLIEIIESGDGEARIKGFTDDAVYLHHYEQMIVEQEVLAAYLRKTYTPAAGIYVDHKLGRCYDFGSGYSLVHGHYKGGWTANGGGTFEGNFLNIQRLEEGGRLKTYRSWTNNDR